MKRTISVGKQGARLGEDNGRAKLTDGEVDLIRTLHEAHRMPYALLAEKFEVSVSLVGKICRCERRAQFAETFRTVECTQ